MVTGVQGGCDPEISPATFETIGRVLKAHSGFSLEGYKDKCVKRRINIRIRATHSPSPEAYSAFLTENPAEQEHLLRVLTIHVSHFFRNPSTFRKLSREILPELLNERGPGIRLMSIGCAGGEEPYSLAIMLREHYGEALSAGHFSIKGTDVDLPTLAGARSALYHPDRLAEVAPELLSRWFTPEGERFRLNQEIRSLVSFDHADLNGQVVCEECDLILCRNVLIYFERSRQEAILNGFADALKSGGTLVLGKSETLFGPARRRFRTVCPVERIYRVI
ncbi:MAG: chemotaxis protein CheR [Geobacteraceae bacterium GWC2_58_44]|nr:MAG: chemotaxis protein CheR [Geobacteraceae bacterium GWC2_58_44]